MGNNRVIGIVTIDDYTNYGNRLQNYALTKLLENEGIKVINGIIVHTKEDWINSTDNCIKRLIKRFIPFSIVKNKLYHKRQIKNNLLQSRKERFLEFIKSYTTLLEPIVVTNHKKANEILDSYDIRCYVAGSDQIWNPYYEGKEYEFLAFASKGKRFSFAASIGADSIPNEKKSYYKKYLSGMDYISVREERAAEIVKELTGKTADIVLDPTLLLSEKEWENAIKKPNIDLKEHYICAYFLGEIPEVVTEFAKRKNLIIYKLNSEDDQKLFCIDPSEFLFIIKNADYILTDSFHAVAFSIKFKKEFYVFKRHQLGVSNMFSRIETITKKFNLENRIQEWNSIVEADRIVVWNEIDRELENERKKSIEKILRVMGL